MEIKAAPFQGFKTPENLVRNIWIKAFAETYDIEYVIRPMKGRARVKGANLDNARATLKRRGIKATDYLIFDADTELVKQESMKAVRGLSKRFRQPEFKLELPYTDDLQNFIDKYPKKYSYNTTDNTLVLKGTMYKEQFKMLRKIYPTRSDKKKIKKFYKDSWGIGFIQFESYTINPQETYLSSVKSIAERGYWAFFLPLRALFGFTPCNGHNCILSEELLEAAGGWAPKGETLVAEDLDVVLRAGMRAGLRGLFATFCKLGEGSPADFMSFCVQAFKFGVGSTELLLRRFGELILPNRLKSVEKKDVITNLAKFPATLGLIMLFLLSSVMNFSKIPILYSSLAAAWTIPAVIMMSSPNSILVALVWRRQLAYDADGVAKPSRWSHLWKLVTIWIPLTAAFTGTMPYTAKGAAHAIRKTLMALPISIAEKYAIYPWMQEVEREFTIPFFNKKIEFTEKYSPMQFVYAIAGYTFLYMSGLAFTWQLVVGAGFMLLSTVTIVSNIWNFFFVTIPTFPLDLIYNKVSKNYYVGDLSNWIKKNFTMATLTDPQASFLVTLKGKPPERSVVRITWDHPFSIGYGVILLVLNSTAFIMYGSGVMGPLSLSIFLLVLISMIAAPYLFEPYLTTLFSGGYEKASKSVKMLVLMPFIALAALKFIGQQTDNDALDTILLGMAGVVGATPPDSNQSQSQIQQEAEKVVRDHWKPRYEKLRKYWSGSIKILIVVLILLVIGGGPIIETGRKWINMQQVEKARNSLKTLQEINVKLMQNDRWIIQNEKERDQAERYLKLNNILVDACRYGIKQLNTVDKLFVDEAMTDADLEVSKAVNMYNLEITRSKDYYVNLLNVLRDDMVKLGGAYSEKDLIRSLTDSYEEELRRFNDYHVKLKGDIIIIGTNRTDKTKEHLKTKKHLKILDDAETLINDEMERVEEVKREIEAALRALKKREPNASATPMRPEAFEGYKVFVYGPIDRAKKFIEWNKKVAVGRAEKLKEMHQENLVNAHAALETAIKTRTRADKNLKKHNKKVTLLKKARDKQINERDRQKIVAKTIAIETFKDDPTAIYPLLERLFDLRVPLHDESVIQELARILDTGDPIVRLNKRELVEFLKKYKQPLNEYRESKYAAIKEIIEAGVPIGDISFEDVLSPDFKNSDRFKNLKINKVRPRLEAAHAVMSALEALKSYVAEETRDLISEDITDDIKRISDSIPDFLKPELSVLEEGYAFLKDMYDVSIISRRDLLPEIELLLAKTKEAAEIETDYLTTDTREVKRTVMLTIISLGIPYRDVSYEEIDNYDFIDTYKFKGTDLKSELAFIEKVIYTLDGVKDKKISPSHFLFQYPYLAREFEADNTVGKVVFEQKLKDLKKQITEAIKNEKEDIKVVDRFLGKLRLKAPEALAFLKEKRMLQQDSEIEKEKLLSDDAEDFVINMEQLHNLSVGKFDGSIILLQNQLKKLLKNPDIVKADKERIQVVIDKLDELIKLADIKVPKVQSESETVNATRDFYPRDANLIRNAIEVMNRRLKNEGLINELLGDIRGDLNSLKDMQVIIPAIEIDRERLKIEDIFQFLNKIKKTHILNIVELQRELIHKQILKFIEVKKKYEAMPEGKPIPRTIVTQMLKSIAVPQEILEKYALESEMVRFETYAEILKKINKGIPIEKVLYKYVPIPKFAKLSPKRPVTTPLKQPPRVLGLAEAARMAVRNSNNVQRALIRVERATSEEQFDEIKLLHPGVNLLAAVDRDKGLGLGVGGTLTSSLENFEAAKLAKINIEMKDAEFQMTVRAEISKMTNLWMELFSTEAEIQSIKDLIAKVKRDGYETAIDKNYFGKTEVLDIPKAKHMVLELQKRLIKAEWRNTDLQTEIHSMLPIPDDVPIKTGINLKGEDPLKSIEKALSVLDDYKNDINPGLMGKAVNEKYLNALKRVQRAKMLPKANVGGAAIISQRGKFEPHASVSVDIPIHDSKSGLRIELSKLRLQLNEKQWVRLVKELTDRKESAEIKGQLSASMYGATIDTVGSFTDNLKKTLDEYKKGSLGIDELLKSLDEGDTIIEDKAYSLARFASANAAGYEIGRVEAPEVTRKRKGMPSRKRPEGAEPILKKYPVVTNFTSIGSLSAMLKERMLALQDYDLMMQIAETEGKVAGKRDVRANLSLIKDFPGDFRVGWEISRFTPANRNSMRRAAHAYKQQIGYKKQSFVNRIVSRGFDLAIDIQGGEKQIKVIDQAIEEMQRSLTLYKTRFKLQKEEAERLTGGLAVKKNAEVRDSTFKIRDIEKEIRIFNGKKIRLKVEIADSRAQLNAMLLQPIDTPIMVAMDLDDNSFLTGDLGGQSAQIEGYDIESEIKAQEALIVRLKNLREGIRRRSIAPDGVYVGPGGAGVNVRLGKRGKSINLSLNPVKTGLSLLKAIFGRGESRGAREKRLKAVAAKEAERIAAERQLAEMKARFPVEANKAKDRVDFTYYDLERKRIEINFVEQKIARQQQRIKTGKLDEQRAAELRLIDLRVELVKLKLDQTALLEEYNKAKYSFMRYRDIWKKEAVKVTKADKRKIVKLTMADFIKEYVSNDPKVLGMKKALQAEKKEARRVKKENPLKGAEVLRAADLVGDEMTYTTDNEIADIKVSSLKLTIEPKQVKINALRNMKMDSRVNQAQASVRVSELEARVAAMRIYVDMLQAQFKTDAAKSNYISAKKALRVVDRQYRAKLISKQALETAKAKVDVSKMQLNKEQMMMMGIERILGRYLPNVTAATKIELKEDFSQISGGSLKSLLRVIGPNELKTRSDSDIDDYLKKQLETAFAGIPQVRNAIDKMSEANIDIQIARTQRFKPVEIDIFASGILVRFPVDVSKGRKIKVEIARKALEELGEDYEETLREAKLEIQLLNNKLEGIAQQIANATDLAVTTKGTMDYTLIQFSNGLKTQDDVATTREAYFMARLAQLSAFFEFQLLKSELDTRVKQLGIDPESIKEGAEIVTPTQILGGPKALGMPGPRKVGYADILQEDYFIPEAGSIDYVVGMLKANVEMNKDISANIQRLIKAIKGKKFTKKDAGVLAIFLGERLEEVSSYVKDTKINERFTKRSKEHAALVTLREELKSKIEEHEFETDVVLKEKLIGEIAKLSAKLNADQNAFKKKMVDLLLDWSKTSPLNLTMIALLNEVNLGYGQKDDLLNLQMLVMQGSDFQRCFRNRLSDAETEKLDGLLLEARGTMQLRQQGELPELEKSEIEAVTKKAKSKKVDVDDALLLARKEKEKAQFEEINTKLQDTIQHLLTKYTTERTKLRRLENIIKEKIAYYKQQMAKIKGVKSKKKTYRKLEKAVKGLTAHAKKLRVIIKNYEGIQKSLFSIAKAKMTNNEYIYQKKILDENTEERLMKAEKNLRWFVRNLHKQYTGVHKEFTAELQKEVDDIVSKNEKRLKDIDETLETKTYDDGKLLAMLKDGLTVYATQLTEEKTANDTELKKIQKKKIAKQAYDKEKEKTLKDRNKKIKKTMRMLKLSMKSVDNAIKLYKQVEESRKKYIGAQYELLNARRVGDFESEKSALQRYNEWKTLYDTRLKNFKWLLGSTMMKVSRYQPEQVKEIITKFIDGKLKESELMEEKVIKEEERLRKRFGGDIAINETFVKNLMDLIKDNVTLSEFMAERTKLVKLYDEYRAKYELAKVKQTELDLMDPISADLDRRIEIGRSVEQNKYMIDQLEAKIAAFDSKIGSELSKPENASIREKIYSQFVDVTKNVNVKAALTTFGVKTEGYIARFYDMGLGDLINRVKKEAKSSVGTRAVKFERMLQKFDNLDVVKKLLKAKRMKARLRSLKTKVANGEFDILTNKDNEAFYNKMLMKMYGADAMAKLAITDFLDIFYNDQDALALMNEWDRDNGITEDATNKRWFIKAFNERIVPLYRKATQQYQKLLEARKEAFPHKRRLITLKAWADTVKSNEDLIAAVLAHLDPNALSSYIKFGVIRDQDIGDPTEGKKELFLRKLKEIPGKIVEIKEHLVGKDIFDFKEPHPALHTERDNLILNMRMVNGLWTTAEKTFYADLYTQARATLYQMSKGDYKDAKLTFDQINEIIETQKEQGEFKGLIPNGFDSNGRIVASDVEIGNNAWYLMSLYRYTVHEKDTAYVGMAEELVSSILERQATNGGFANTFVRDGKENNIQSAEQNIDARKSLKLWGSYFKELADKEADPVQKKKLSDQAQKIEAALRINLSWFADVIYNKKDGMFNRGVNNLTSKMVDGKRVFEDGTVDTRRALDVHSWALLSGLFEDLAKKDPKTFNAQLIYSMMTKIGTDHVKEVKYWGKYNKADYVKIKGVLAEFEVASYWDGKQVVNFEDTTHYILGLKKAVQILHTEASVLHAEGKSEEARKLQKMAVELVQKIDEYQYEILEAMTESRSYSGQYGLPMATGIKLNFDGLDIDPSLIHLTTSINSLEAESGFNVFDFEKLPDHKMVSYETQKDDTLESISDKVFGNSTRGDIIKKNNPGVDFDEPLYDGIFLLLPLFLGLRRFKEEAEEYVEEEDVTMMGNAGFKPADMEVIRGEIERLVAMIQNGTYNQQEEANYEYPLGITGLTFNFNHIPQHDAETGVIIGPGEISYTVRKMTPDKRKVFHKYTRRVILGTSRGIKLYLKKLENQKQIIELAQEKEVIRVKDLRVRRRARALEKMNILSRNIAKVWHGGIDTFRAVIEAKSVNYTVSLIVKAAAMAISIPVFVGSAVWFVLKGTYTLTLLAASGIWAGWDAISPRTKRGIYILILIVGALFAMPTVGHASTLTLTAEGAQIFNPYYFGGAIIFFLKMIQPIGTVISDLFNKIATIVPPKVIEPVVEEVVPITIPKPVVEVPKDINRDMLIKRAVQLLSEKDVLKDVLNDQEARVLLSIIIRDMMSKGASLDEAAVAIGKSPRALQFVQSLIFDMMPNMPKNAITRDALAVLAENNDESAKYLKGLIANRVTILRLDEVGAIQDALNIYAEMNYLKKSNKPIVNAKQLNDLKNYLNKILALTVVNDKLIDVIRTDDLKAVKEQLARDSQFVESAARELDKSTQQIFVDKILMSPVRNTDKISSIVIGAIDYHEARGLVGVEASDLMREKLFKGQLFTKEENTLIAEILLSKYPETVKEWIGVLIVGILIEKYESENMAQVSKNLNTPTGYTRAQPLSETYTESEGVERSN